MPQLADRALKRAIDRAVWETPITDIHTHLHAPGFHELLLWGIDELLTYHYLVAEAFRYLDMPYADFWAMGKSSQAELIWQTLFIEHSPVSESCRGVLTTLDRLGLDVGARDLHSRRIIADVLYEKYADLRAAGWAPTEAEMQRDVANLLGGNFRAFAEE